MLSTVSPVASDTAVTLLKVSARESSSATRCIVAVTTTEPLSIVRVTNVAETFANCAMLFFKFSCLTRMKSLTVPASVNTTVAWVTRANPGAMGGAAGGDVGGCAGVFSIFTIAPVA